jgi:RNA polymerase sigma factor (sigma-70 family)
LEHLTAYIRSIDSLGLISIDEEKRLSTIIQESENTEEVDEAINSLVTANLRLVVNRALKFSKRYPRIGLMNLISDGNLALIRSAELYKHELKAKFGTYATYCIDKSFFQTMSANDLIRIPSNQNDVLTKLSRLQAKSPDEFDDEDTMEALDIGKDSLDLLKDAKRSKFVKSLDEPVGNDGQVTPLINLIADQSTPATEHQADLVSLRQYLQEKMTILTDRERDILNIAYLEGPEYSFTELAERMGLSRERCRQLLCRAEHKMRKFIGKPPHLKTSN